MLPPAPREPLAAAKHWHALSVRHSTMSMEAAKRCGAVLLRQRSVCERKRGGSTFSEWMKGLPFSRSQALRYMSLCEHWQLVPRGTSSLREAGEVIASYRRTLKAEKRAAGVSPIADDVIHGDFREVELSGVDLVLTDPPYADVGLYRDLGVWAAKVLRPGGLLVAYSGQFHLPGVLAGLCESLDYLWTFHVPHQQANQLVHARNVFCRWKPALLLGKPPIETWWPCLQDSIPSGGRDKTLHLWQQPTGEAEHFISHLCPAGGVVADPMTGSGTVGIAARKLGRKFVGIEVDAGTVRVARRRAA